MASRIARTGKDPRLLRKVHILPPTSETTCAPKLPTAIDLIHGASMMASLGIRPRIANRLPQTQLHICRPSPFRLDLRGQTPGFVNIVKRFMSA